VGCLGPTLCPKSIDNQEPGILYSLLFQSYADLLESDPIHWKPEENNWNEFDRDAFEHPEAVGACVFLCCHARNIIGFASFDPRQAPKIGIIGHNCILPAFRGQGFGKQQINEILYRFTMLGIQTATVTTNDNPFFVPAQRMYKSCGFQKKSREFWTRDKTQNLIHYQKRIG
jgi:GNAT superfamily N-acetyltransferase